MGLHGKNSAIPRRSIYETRIIQDLKRFLSETWRKASLVPVVPLVFHSGFILVTQKLITLENPRLIGKNRTHTTLYTHQHRTFTKLYTIEAAPHGGTMYSCSPLRRPAASGIPPMRHGPETCKSLHRTLLSPRWKSSKHRLLERNATLSTLNTFPTHQTKRPATFVAGLSIYVGAVFNTPSQEGWIESQDAL